MNLPCQLKLDLTEVISKTIELIFEHLSPFIVFGKYNLKTK